MTEIVCALKMVLLAPIFVSVKIVGTSTMTWKWMTRKMRVMPHLTLTVKMIIKLINIGLLRFSFHDKNMFLEKSILLCNLQHLYHCCEV